MIAFHFLTEEFFKWKNTRISIKFIQLNHIQPFYQIIIDLLGELVLESTCKIFRLAESINMMSKNRIISGLKESASKCSHAKGGENLCY